jgi:hypothetical protein
MCERVLLTPLTPEEQAFAEENHGALEWCMKIQKLDAELYDVAAFGYLLAVKKWFARPEVRKWSFKTVVKHAVRSSIGNERKKQDRRIRTVSLDDVIPGTDDLTYGDTVTEENIRYLTGGKEKKSMKISYNVKIPETARQGRLPSVEVEMVIEFIASSHKNMCLEYDDVNTAKGKISTIRSWKKKNNREDINVFRMSNSIFVEKTNARSKKGEKQ